MAKKKVEQDVRNDSRYHDTRKLLRKYRDVTWSLELSVQRLKNQFHVEYGTDIEEFFGFRLSGRGGSGRHRVGASCPVHRAQSQNASVVGQRGGTAPYPAQERGNLLLTAVLHLFIPATIPKHRGDH